MWDDYLFPQSVDEALEMLGSHGGEARIIAGGTDLAIQSQRGRVQAMVMVDITRIPGLDQIEERDGYVHVGARVTHESFGRGKIVALDGRGEQARAIVDFDGIGRKHLMLKFAHLRPT